jgi:hypothetical protein
MGHEGLLFYRLHPSGLIEEERRYLDSLTPMAQLGLLGALPARPLPTLPTEMKADLDRRGRRRQLRDHQHPRGRRVRPRGERDARHAERPPGPPLGIEQAVRRAIAPRSFR